jgi:hypothetical protein
MVKALFDFDTGGYPISVDEGQERKNKGELSYPREFSDQYGRVVPHAMFVSYSAYVEQPEPGPGS